LRFNLEGRPKGKADARRRDGNACSTVEEETGLRPGIQPVPYRPHGLLRPPRPAVVLQDTAVIDGDPHGGERANGGFRDSHLRERCGASLDPLFWTPARPGVASAWHGHVPFAHWVVHALRPRVIVELGTHSGVSYSAFCEGVVQSRLDTRCYAVDTWEGDEHAGAYGEAVYQEFKTFHDSRYAGFSRLLRTTFDDAADHFADGSVDLLHIDGFHSYEAVSGDFRRWRPKLSGRGVVLFHDTNVREQGFGVWRFWEEVRKGHRSFEFLHGYGLGVLILGAEAPAAVAALGALADPDAITRIRDRFATLGQRHVLDFGLASVEHKAESVRLQLAAETSRNSELGQELEAARARGAGADPRGRSWAGRGRTAHGPPQRGPHSRGEAEQAERWGGPGGAGVGRAVASAPRLMDPPPLRTITATTTTINTARPATSMRPFPCLRRRVRELARALNS